MSDTTYKCDSCKHKCHHPAGSFLSVTEGDDDPYVYNYCDKGHWEGDDIDDFEPKIDLWKDCKDYE